MISPSKGAYSTRVNVDLLFSEKLLLRHCGELQNLAVTDVSLPKYAHLPEPMEQLGVHTNSEYNFSALSSLDLRGWQYLISSGAYLQLDEASPRAHSPSASHLRSFQIRSDT